MKIVNSIRRFASIKIFSFMKKNQNPIEVLEYQLSESKRHVNDLSEQLSNFRAKRTVLIENQKKTAKDVVKLDLIIQQAIRSNNDPLGEMVFLELEKNRQKQEIQEKNLAYISGIIYKLEEQYEPLRQIISERESTLESLRMKHEFAKSIGKINQELKGQLKEFNVDFTSIEDIENEISQQMHYEIDQNERITTQNTLQQMKVSQGKLSYLDYKEKKLGSGQ